MHMYDPIKQHTAFGYRSNWPRNFHVCIRLNAGQQQLSISDNNKMYLFENNEGNFHYYMHISVMLWQNVHKMYHTICTSMYSVILPVAVLLKVIILDLGVLILFPVFSLAVVRFIFPVSGK